MLLLLLALAVYRVTRLIVADGFPPIAAARFRIQRRYGPESWQAYLSECPWCVSVYVAGALTLATDLAAGVPVPLLVWPAASAVTGLIASNFDPE